MIKTRVKNAFTMAETLIAMVMLGILGACAISAMHPSTMKADALVKSGANSLIQISFATKQILAKNSVNYQMTKLLSTTGTQFSINDSGADEKLMPLYKRTLIASRKSSIPSSYTTSDIRYGSGTKINVKISDFTQGTQMRNGMYMALMLHNNCTTSETYIYDPSVPENRNVANSCGLIFFDVNAQDAPNLLGVDQYIVSIGKLGIK